MSLQVPMWYFYCIASCELLLVAGYIENNPGGGGGGGAGGRYPVAPQLLQNQGEKKTFHIGDAMTCGGIALIIDPY